MASDQTLRAIITVLDRTSEPLRQINARFAAMSSPLRQIGSRISELGELTGITNIGEHAGEALEKVRHLGEGLMEIAGPLAALGAAGSLAGLVEIAKSTAEFAENLDIGAAKTGIATETLAGWHYAAGLVNIDVQQLDKGFTYLNRNISEAAAGKAKDVEQILRKLGFNNTPGHLVGTGQALKAVSDAVEHLVDSGNIQGATSMMAKLFGARQGAQLLPLFEKGPEELQRALDGAREAGISLTSSQTAAGHEFMEQYKGMSASVDGLKLAIGNELFPVLRPVIQGFKDWLNDHRAQIARNIGNAVKYLSTEIKAIDWTHVKADIREFGADAEWVIKKVGGIGPAVAIVAAISLAPTIQAFGELGGAVAAAAGKFVLFPVAGLLADFARLIPTIRSLRDVQIALNIAMDANPIGAVIAVATTLGVIGYEVYQHWSEVKDFFKGLWDGLPDWTKTGIGAVGAALKPFIAIPAEIMAHWREIIGFFKDLWDKIKVPDWISHGFSAGAGAGPGAGGFVDPTTGAFIPGALTQPPLSTLPGARAAAGAAAPGPQGDTKVTVDFKNLPPGATVSTESRGNASPPSVDVGYAFAY